MNEKNINKRKFLIPSDYIPLAISSTCSILSGLIARNRWVFGVGAVSWSYILYMTLTGKKKNE